MEIIPPTWLLAHTVIFSLKLNAWRSYKGISISPIVIGTRRLVDRAHSPMFRAIFDTKEKLTVSNFKNANSIIAGLHTTIKNILEYREASALDEDDDRNTLLSVKALVQTIQIFQLTIDRKFFAYIAGIRAVVFVIVNLKANTLDCCNSSLLTGRTGFKDIWSPNEKGLSPMLQNWHCANFEMVQWFIDKGVSPD